ncbi:MAG: UDP-N-acetylmuramate dehydrogenase [Proteobacteria bacterium]|nr:UDP-N-acetylmuramate dehydrogenase [Pseudomonadota bacterium]
MITASHLSALESAANAPVREDVSFARYTSFNIGGPAAFFVNITERHALAKTVTTAKTLGLETLVLGGGTNLLISDDGFDGLVIRIDFRGIHIDSVNCTVRVGSGVSTSRLVETLIDAGLGGLVFAAGLPGTIGGAIAGNAGCFGHNLSDFMESAEVVEPDGKIHRITNPDWFCFQYRRSHLIDSGAVLTEVTFKLEPKDKDSLQTEAAKYLAVRAERHPSKGEFTAGSYFKNLPPVKLEGPRRAAGELLDQAGVHGLSVGDAAVFERHANIIINRSKATARDVLTLAAEMKRRVYKRFGVELTEEVRFVGKRPNLCAPGDFE